MGIQTEVLSISTGANVVVASSDETGVESRREARLTLKGAAAHGLLS